MTKLENHHIATPKATIDIGNLNPWKDFTIKCNAYGEIYDGWISTLLNLSSTKRRTMHTLCASLIINATGSVLHHLGNILAHLHQKKKKKINVESDQASRSVLFNRTFCSYGNVLYLHRMVATRYLWLFGIWNMANATKELNFQFSFILIHFNSHSWLVAAIIYSAILDLTTGLKEIDIHVKRYHGDTIS